MTQCVYTELTNRGVLAVSGEDRIAYLQGLTSNDVAKAGAEKTLYSAVLTPQGKFLFDFFIFCDGDRLLLDVEADRLADLQKRLSMYKLRSKVELEDVSNTFTITAVFGEGAVEALGLAKEPGATKAFTGGMAAVDPRLAEAGARILAHKGAVSHELDKVAQATDFAAYDRHRMLLGLADGSRDMELEKAILLENGFDELHGVDWQKGCFMGQELTARTRYRGLIKKRLMPVEVEGEAPAVGTPLMLGEKEAGEMRSSHGDIGIALIRLDAFAQGVPLTADHAKLTPRKPDWMVLPESAADKGPA